MLVVVCGVPGAGKTSVARHVVDQVDGEMLRTDVVRKDLFDEPEYTEAEGAAVYEELLARAEDVVADGGVAVLDGTFHAAAFRERAVRTADRIDADCRFLKVECDPDVARERIRAREGDESDADVRVHDLIREEFDPLAVDHATIDNSGSLEATYRQVTGALGPPVASDGAGRS